MLFHHLHQIEQGVKVDSDHYFGQLDDNPIIEAESKLLDEVIEWSVLPQLEEFKEMLSFMPPC